MKNANTSKIVVAALAVTLVVHDIILVRMLKDERLNGELYEREYRRVIDQSCMEHAELTSRIHDLEWRLKRYGEEP